MNAEETIAALRAENEQLRTDLDSRFEHSDHQSAKYYHRMRKAELGLAAVREQLAAIQADETVEPLAEMFPGTYALLEQLTIRKKATS